MTENTEFATKLREKLIERGLLLENRFKELMKEAEGTRRSMMEVLVDSGIISEKDLAILLSELTSYPPINVMTFVIEPDVLKLIGKETAKKYQVLPISLYEGTLTVAIADPTNLPALDDVRAQTGLRIKPALGIRSQLKTAIGKYYGDGTPGLAAQSSESFDEIVQDIRSQSLSQANLVKGLGEASDLLEEARSTPVIRLVNHMLIDAIRRRASDVFVEALERTMRVRYRIDGALEEILNVSRSFVGPVISRIKVMSRLNIAEHRIPQDGRIKVRILGREIDLRVSIIPTCFGEKACLRILDSAAQTQSLERLGFQVAELEVIRRNAEKPHGLILVTGPTGSGKTTTLYAVLEHLNSLEKNITTVEEPVEYQMRGINQVNVRDQVGLTFPIALRSILRQDPDIILIGEVRDQITMDIAIKSALTGHLVLSTLHTNDATSAIVRMTNMGIEPFLMASSLLMISAQRLVRKLCSTCRTPFSPDSQLRKTLGLDANKKLTFYGAKGCPQCRNTGYSGRTVITELFEMTPTMLDKITKAASGDQLRRLAREAGMKTLRENGIEKAEQGITTPLEIMRVTSPDEALEGVGV